MSNSSRSAPKIDGMVSLKVDNLTYRTTSDDLRKVFDRCGDVGDIYIPRDRNSRSSRGFAFVRFFERRDAEKALQEMDGRLLDGRELRVQMARYGRPNPNSPQRRFNRHGGDRDRDRRRSRSRDRRGRRHSRDRRQRRRSRSRSHTRSDSKSSRGHRSRSRSHSPSRKNRSSSGGKN